MKVRKHVGLAAMCVVVVLVLTVVGVAGAASPNDSYHVGSSLHCSDCHVMHATDANDPHAPYGGGNGIDMLLRGANVNALCMQCHDGTDTTAPCIVATGTEATANAATSTLRNGSLTYGAAFKNSAGFFQSDWATTRVGTSHHTAHALTTSAAVTAIQGTWASGATGMDCGDCHDIHGADNWRKLLTTPGTGGAVSIQVNTDVYHANTITIPATAVATSSHYDTAAVGFASTGGTAVKNWCVGCHTTITTGFKHPADNAVSALGSAAGWAAHTNVGFDLTSPPVAIDDNPNGSGTGAGIPRVRFAEGSGSFGACTTAATTNKVFCLTCHKAHGSKYEQATVWPQHISGALDQTSGCGQCHNMGG